MSYVTMITSDLQPASAFAKKVMADEGIFSLPSQLPLICHTVLFIN